MLYVVIVNTEGPYWNTPPAHLHQAWVAGLHRKVMVSGELPGAVSLLFFFGSHLYHSLYIMLPLIVLLASLMNSSLLFFIPFCSQRSFSSLCYNHFFFFIHLNLLFFPSFL